LLQNKDLNIKIHDRDWLEQAGTVLLVAAGVVVAIAIAASGPIARGTNGVAGILWITSAVMLVASRRGDPRFWSRLASVAAIGLGLVLYIKPSDLTWAIAGFGAAGLLIAYLFGEQGIGWAKVLPALWLPEHLATAVGRAVYRAVRDLPTSVRTDPPPTAAFVPLAMILAAWGGAVIVDRLRSRRQAEKNPPSTV
jgi:hypothetical protein